VRLKKPTELFEQRRLQSLAEEDAKKEKVEVKNKRIISPKELFGEVVEVEDPLIVEEIVEEPVDPYLEEIDALKNDLERISYKIPEETDLTKVYQDIKNLKNRIDSLPKQKSYDEDIESIREELATIEGSIPVPEVFDPSDLYKNISALKNKLEEVRSEIPSIPEPILYDNQLDQLKELVINVRNSIPVVPEIRYYEPELNLIIDAIEQVHSEIPVVPEIKYYDDEISTIESHLIKIQESIPIVKYYDDEIDILNQKIDYIKESIPVVPEVKYYDEDVKKLNDKIDYIKESIPVVPEVKYYDKEIRDLNEEVQELYKKVLSIKIPNQDEYIKEIDELYSSFEEKNHRLLEKINYLEKVFDNFNEKTLLNEGLLNEPPEIKTKDPLTPLDQNFVTLDQLQSHYRLFINRIQQQLSTIGGGGETRLEFLDDVDRDSAKVDGYVLAYQASTGKFIGTSVSGGGSASQWVSTTAGIHTLSNVGIGTTNPTEALFVVGNAVFTGNISVAGTVTYDDVTNVDSVGVITARQDVIVQRNLFVSGITTLGASNGIGTVTIGIGNTALLVEGNARVTGILSIGQGTVTIDGNNNTITSGQVTISGSSITLGDNVVINAGASGINSAPNVLYVAKDGNNNNNGTSIDNAKLTIASAVSIAQSGTTIKVLSGSYNENNPIIVPPFVAIVGDSLKTVTVVPNNSTQDIFHLNKGTYLSQMTFTGHTAPSAAVAFPTGIATNVGGGSWESPYVQNCTSNTTTGTGMRIDGALAEELKSMVVDSYTQYNQGGVGIAITNNGYAQLVSVFTICCSEAITVHKGGQCSLTNSNSDFGTFGLVANGVSDLQFVGTAASATAGTDNVTVAITTTTRPYEGQVVYFGELYQSVNTITVTNGGSGYTTAPTVTIAAPAGPSGITATAFASILNGSVTEITLITSGSQYTEAPSITISAPGSGTTATATATTAPIYYTINSSTPIVSGTTTLTLEENLNNTVSTGSTVYFFQVSKITASSHTFEYVGSGNTIATATPSRGGVPIPENEIIETAGGRVVFTSTDQSGNFKIGNDITINQNNGTITGRAFTRSLFNQMTPFILALS
jgi:hypothetical protein